MQWKAFFKHILFWVVGLTLIFLPAFLYTQSFWVNLCNGGLDAIASSTVILDQPSGNYVVLINEDFRGNDDILNDWISFFSGEEVDFIFEDISCSIPTGDEGALALGESFQSRLPENQMKIKIDNSMLLTSRIDYEKFNIVIMSKEFVDANQVEIEDSEDVQIIFIE